MHSGGTCYASCQHVHVLLCMLQALAKGNTTKAVKCLRMELAPLQIDTAQLHKLANAVMCQDEDDLQKFMDWSGPENGSRQHLLNSLQVCRPVTFALPHALPRKDLRHLFCSAPLLSFTLDYTLQMSSLLIVQTLQCLRSRSACLRKLYRLT